MSSKYNLESEMFDIITNIYISYSQRDKASFDAFLDILEELNDEYEITYGNPRYSKEELLNLHSKKWEFYA